MVSPTELHSRSGWLAGMSWLTMGMLGSFALTAVAGLLIARSLSPRNLGLYAAITVATALIGTLISFGLDLHLVTALTDADDTHSVYSASARAAYTLSFAASVIGGAIAWNVLPRTASFPLLIDLGEVLLSPITLRQVILQVGMNQRAMTVNSMINRAAWAVAVGLILAIRPGDELVCLMIARVGVVAIQGLCLRFATPLESSVPVTLREKVLASAQALRESAPLAAGSILGFGYDRLDQLLVPGFRGAAANGLYAGAVRIAEVPGILAPIVQNVSMPSIVRLSRSQRGQEEGLYDVISDALLLTILPGGLGVIVTIVFTRPLIIAVLGERYIPAAPTVVVLGAAEWVTLPATIYMIVAIAAGRRKPLAFATGTGFAVNLVLNLILVPLIGIEGAAIASLGAYSVSCIGIALISMPRGRLRVLTAVLVLRLAIATAATAVVGRLVWFNLPVTIPIVVAVYLVSTGLALPRRDVRRLAQQARRGISSLRLSSAGIPEETP
jgi:O-antigen/teichoic acid export membrane protein